MNQQYLDRMAEVLKNAVDERFIIGGNLLVLQNGKEMTYAEAGFSNERLGKPMRRDAIFRLYSMSKPITACAFMILMERGLVDLLEPVEKYLPAFKDQKVLTKDGLEKVHRPLQIRDLLGMNSGMCYGDPFTESGKQSEAVFAEAISKMNTEEAIGTVELVSWLAKIPLRFHPGEDFMYGTSADVIGALIEVISGMRFGEFLKKEIFEPLEMKDTGFYVPEEKQDRLTTVYVLGHTDQEYTRSHLCVSNDMKRPPAFESGGAGLVSTIDDYAAFATMLLNGGELNGVRILQPKTVEYFTTRKLSAQQQRSFDRDWQGLAGYSYGNFMRVLWNPERTMYTGFSMEYGWDGWLGPYFCNAPEEKITFLLMYQLTDTGTTELTRKLRNVLGGAVE